MRKAGAKLTLTLIACFVLSATLKCQQSSDIQQLIDSKRLVLRTQIIENFNNYAYNGEYITFLDVYLELSANEKITFLREYLTTDLDQETFLTLKSKTLEIEKSGETLDDEINWFAQLKEDAKERNNSIVYRY